MLKKLWHDPVWSKVIAALILSALAAVASYFQLWTPIADIEQVRIEEKLYTLP
jgi:hypothetical protein